MVRLSRTALVLMGLTSSSHAFSATYTCAHEFELNTTTVCGDCSKVVYEMSTRQGSCIECHYNIPTGYRFPNVTKGMLWGRKGCTMFDWEYLNKHPFTSILMLLLSALIIFVLAYGVRDYLKERKEL